MQRKPQDVEDTIHLTEGDLRAFTLTTANLDIVLHPGDKIGLFQIFITVRSDGKEPKVGVLTGARHHTKNKAREMSLKTAYDFIGRHLPFVESVEVAYVR